eukprot:349687-Chlamydomonas_euryale.AAC.10
MKSDDACHSTPTGPASSARFSASSLRAGYTRAAPCALLIAYPDEGCVGRSHAPVRSTYGHRDSTLRPTLWM